MQSRSDTIFSSQQLNRYSRELHKGSEKLNLALDSEQIADFIDYLALFHKWNKAYNLSAIRDPDLMPAKHILDSLSVLPYINGRHVLDLGTGAGLPGIPLAISKKQSHFHLLDSNGKKTRFLFQVKQVLSLENVTIVNERVEKWQENIKFDQIICRAFSSLAGIIEGTKHLLSSEGKILAMKGLIPTDELREVEKHYIVEAVQELNVPGVAGERNLIILSKRK